eukprot:9835359-Alexandrium_andersonii.AAC.1
MEWAAAVAWWVLGMATWAVTLRQFHVQSCWRPLSGLPKYGCQCTCTVTVLISSTPLRWALR